MSPTLELINLQRNWAAVKSPARTGLTWKEKLPKKTGKEETYTKKRRETTVRAKENIPATINSHRKKESMTSEFSIYFVGTEWVWNSLSQSEERTDGYSIDYYVVV